MKDIECIYSDKMLCFLKEMSFPFDLKTYVFIFLLSYLVIFSPVMLFEGVYFTDVFTLQIYIA
eukprot:snap_masked-scaffold_26-processed-gene-4.34-mRNA-1 protein AED:1.00 eAED:1.00 QI:0/0/0/0/1/1/2/0/62